MMQATSFSPKKGCPPWAEEMIETLRNVEVFLGNLPKGAVWESSYVRDLAQKTFPYEPGQLSEEAVELLFTRIAKKMIEDGFSVQEIAGFINRRLRYEKSPPYCNEAEIVSCLQ